MEKVSLPPDLERFAIEVVSDGRYSDVAAVVAAGVQLLRLQENARAEFVKSLQEAENEADRVGCVSLNELDISMRQAIQTVANRGS
jgi:putative addiction module CopG family antidote